MSPPPWIKDEDEWWRQCRRLVAKATEFIEGKTRLIEISREINRLSFYFRTNNDSDFMLFKGIDSETDHLPFGSAKQYWASDVLEKKEIEIQQWEAHFQESALEAARSLIKKYQIDQQ